MEQLVNDRGRLGQSDTEKLFCDFYEQLHQRAVRLIQLERGGHTLQPTALLHEAYLRMAQSGQSFQDESHFVASASIVLRHILVNYARARNTQKRSGQIVRVSIDDIAGQFQESAVDILALDEALQELSRNDPTQHRLVELRFFGGMTNQQAAKVLGISERSAYSEWAHARAWLKRRIGDGA